MGSTMIQVKYPLARVLGNAGIFFVTPYIGSTLAGAPSLDIALWSVLIGLILSTSREVIEFGKIKRGF